MNIDLDCQLFIRNQITIRDLVLSESAYFTDDSGTWIISGPRLVQIQAALNEAVYVILRIQGSEVFGLRSGRPQGKEC
jgi:hypothetical protein